MSGALQRYLQTSVVPVFCFEQYASFQAARAGVTSKKRKRMATRPESVLPDVRAMVLTV
jgi:hypothetical protein